MIKLNVVIASAVIYAFNYECSPLSPCNCALIAVDTDFLNHRECYSIFKGCKMREELCSGLLDATKIPVQRFLRGGFLLVNPKISISLRGGFSFLNIKKRNL